MKRVARLLGFLGVVCLLSSCGGRSFITDASYRQRVEQDFNQKKERLPQGDLFAIFDADLTPYEREALEFLYAYMPLADITDYPGEFHLMNVRASRKAAEEMPWGETVPEEVFRHFVLPVRVNNEHLDSARVVFYEELKNRVKSLSLYDAILEVNHWCHEKAIYTPSMLYMQVTGAYATQCHPHNSIACILQYWYRFLKQSKLSVFNISICQHNICFLSYHF